MCSAAGALLLVASLLALPAFFMAAGMGASDQPLRHGWPEYAARMLLFCVIMAVPIGLMWVGGQLMLAGARAAGWLPPQTVP